MRWSKNENILEDEDLKRKYAELLLKTPEDPFKAACVLFPTNTNKAVWVSDNWSLDEDVLAFQNELLTERDEESFLPSKSEFARKIWQKMNNTHVDVDDYTKLGRLYADVRGFIEKPQTTINNNTQNVANRVMVISDKGTEDEWEAKLLKQQKELVSG